MLSVLSEFEDQCLLCCKKFTRLQRPMMVCSSQHVCCQDCLNFTVVDYDKRIVKCSECRQLIDKRLILSYKNFQQVLNLKEDIKQADKFQGSSHQTYIQGRAEIFLSFSRQKEQKLNVMKSTMRYIMSIYFLQENYSSASAICMKLIQLTNRKIVLFAGYGCIEHKKQWENSFYRKSIQEFAYQKSKKNAIYFLSDYDLLALCCMYAPDPQQKQWYIQMIKVFPNRFYLRFGLAMLYYNIGEYLQAENYLMQFINFDKSCSRSFEALGMILLKANYFERAMESAKQALKIAGPFLPISKFILACANPVLTFSQRAHELKLIIIRDPRFVRAYQELGRLHEENCDDKNAIEYYRQSNNSYKVLELNLKSLQHFLEDRSSKLKQEAFNKVLINQKIQKAKDLISTILNSHIDEGCHFDCSFKLKFSESQMALSSSQTLDSMKKICSDLQEFSSVAEQQYEFVETAMEWRNFVLRNVINIISCHEFMQVREALTVVHKFPVSTARFQPAMIKGKQRQTWK